ncbi:hypothetical protein EJB05_31265 [Eragrostis curvula]|uniref:Uncharacterized protein n=1 Tax=Eragrostis curvula TaxID=38414 RepID=A0A5J9UDJ7_9POAL|nr:hypothetical protein EJB05_31265 [Eragrostis curvula]
MAWRRLAKEAMSAQLRRGGVAPAVFAPARSFSATAAACSSATSPTPIGRNLLQNIWSRYSSPALRARAAEYGASAAERVALGVRPHLSGHNLFKGLGTGTALTMMLQETAVAAEQARPFKDISGSPSGSSKNELSSLWPLVRKFQLPVGLILLIVSGWQNPLGLVINILLLIYCSRPSRYSIYLFLQEMRQREMGQNHVVRKEEVLHTRKVDTKDYKFFSIGTVELKDGKVLQLVGMLGSWWIYRVSSAN